MCREKRCSAGKIQQDIAMRQATIAGWGQFGLTAPTWLTLLQRVNLDLKLTKGAICRLEAAMHHIIGTVIGLGLKITQQYRDTQHFSQLTRGCQRNIGRPKNKAQALRCDIDRFCLWSGQNGLGGQCGHFGQFRCGVSGPTRPIPQVQKARL